MGASLLVLLLGPFLWSSLPVRVVGESLEDRYVVEVVALGPDGRRCPDATFEASCRADGPGSTWVQQSALARTISPGRARVAFPRTLKLSKVDERQPIDVLQFEVISERFGRMAAAFPAIEPSGSVHTLRFEEPATARLRIPGVEIRPAVPGTDISPVHVVVSPESGRRPSAWFREVTPVPIGPVDQVLPGRYQPGRYRIRVEVERGGRDVVSEVVTLRSGDNAIDLVVAPEAELPPGVERGR